MKKEEPDRYLRLEHWLQKGATVDPRDLYPAGSSKEKRRAEIANMLIPEVRAIRGKTFGPAKWILPAVLQPYPYLPRAC